jgi:hypothetical protein
MKMLSMGWILVGLLPPVLAGAQGFSALISPPRVETNIKPAQTTRGVLEITQVGPQPGRFKVYTNDWRLEADGGVTFLNDLQPGSCRPWVALERREMTIAGNAKLRFRYEITPPADASISECRFAIMFEGAESGVMSQGGLNVPVSGRIGVIVYAGMPGAQPKLDVVSQRVQGKLPTLEVRNSGTAHGRLSGLLSGTDAKGVRLEFSPAGLPILPGETRSVTLSASIPGGTQIVPINYPATIKGSLEWGGQRVPFEHTFSEP